MSHIFISYSHKDTEYVEKLEAKLIEEGFNVWIDHRIDFGSQWPKAIQDALDACDAFIVVISENSYESKWVQNEVSRADRKGKPFFPLLLQGDAWLAIEALQYVDVRDGSLPPEKFLNRLSSVTPRNKTGTALYAKPVSSSTKQPKVKRTTRKPSRMPFWIGGIVILVLVTLGLGYLLQNFSEPDSLEEPEEPEATVSVDAPPTEAKEGDIWVRPADKMNMIYIPAGEFIMGSEDDIYEMPVHDVYLDAYWMDQTEVTNAMYARCVNEGFCDQVLSFVGVCEFIDVTWNKKVFAPV